MESHVRLILVLALTAILPACSIVEDMLGPGDEPIPQAQPTSADLQSLSELTIATGRYGVMLGQVRDILRLPEPAHMGGEAAEPLARTFNDELVALARQQSSVAHELLTDAGAACQRTALPQAVRAVACSTRDALAGGAKQEAGPSLKAIAARDAGLGPIVIRWWDSVCATVPQSRAGEPHACSIE
jgi:hypothetical protein